MRRALILALLLCYAAPAFGVVSYVGVAGTGGNDSSVTNTVVTLTSSVSAGQSVLVQVLMHSAQASSCSDIRGNIYTVDLTASCPATNAGYLFVCSAINATSAMSVGDTITIHHASSRSAASAIIASGIGAYQAKTNACSDINGAPAPNSGTVATSTANAFLLGVAGRINCTTASTWTPDAPWTAVGQGGTATCGSATEKTVDPGYYVVSSTGTYGYSGTYSPAKQWAAGILAYPETAATATPTNTGTPTSTPTPTATGTNTNTPTTTPTPTATSLTPSATPTVTSTGTATSTPTVTQTSTPTTTPTPTPGANDCCHCANLCAAPSLGACPPGCTITYNAACVLR